MSTFLMEASASRPRGYFHHTLFGECYVPPSAESMGAYERTAQAMDKLRCEGCELRMDENGDVAVMKRSNGLVATIMISQLALGYQHSDVVRQIMHEMNALLVER
jgi:hypothetical protein